MVATLAAGTSAGYYLAQSEYYLGGHEPAGSWIAAGNGFGIAAGAGIDPARFEHLHAGLDETGKALLTNGGGRPDRVPGYDLTFSAPKSVSVLWALGDDALRTAIEAAQAEAVQAGIALLEKHAAFSRRGKGGAMWEKAALSVAAFQHGEARPSEHPDGQTFADPQLHTHAVILNIARRADGTVGTLDGRPLFNWKMASGAIYHLTLASALQRLGLSVTEIGKNGVFEVAGVPADLATYFSARRAEVEAALEAAGMDSAQAPALAGAITKASRQVKQMDADGDRFARWRMIADGLGHSAEAVVGQAIEAALAIRATDRAAEHEKVSDAVMVAAVPADLTATESIFGLRDLMGCLASRLVGSRATLADVERHADRFLVDGAVVELGQDSAGERQMSTAVMITLE